METQPMLNEFRERRKYRGKEFITQCREFVKSKIDAGIRDLDELTKLTQQNFSHRSYDVDRAFITSLRYKIEKQKEAKALQKEAKVVQVEEKPKLPTITAKAVESKKDYMLVSFTPEEIITLSGCISRDSTLSAQDKLKIIFKLTKQEDTCQNHS